jgi:hypothetical protein
LFVENDGDETKTRVAFIKLRVEDLQKLKKSEIDEFEKREQAQLEKQRKQAEAERLEIECHLKEEEQLLEKLRNTSPGKRNWLWWRVTWNVGSSSDGDIDASIAATLGYLSAGVDPKYLIETFDTTHAFLGILASFLCHNIEEVDSLLIIAARLWDKGMLTKKGVSAHSHAPL